MLRGRHGGAAALDALLALVEDHGEDDHRALDHDLPERRDAEDHQAVGQEADDERADERAADVAAPARERGAADDDRGDRVELERLAGLRGGGHELGGDDQADHRGAERPRSCRRAA